MELFAPRRQRHVDTSMWLGVAAVGALPAIASGVGFLATSLPWLHELPMLPAAGFWATLIALAVLGAAGLDDFLDQQGFSPLLREKIVLPMVASVWSAGDAGMSRFPARFLARFLDNHGLLNLADRPRWRTIEGGSRSYVDRLLEPVAERVHTGSGVEFLRRTPEGVAVTRDGRSAVAWAHRQAVFWRLAQPESPMWLTPEVEFGHGAIAASGSRCALLDNRYHVRVWDLESGTELVSLRGHRRLVQHIEFSRDGKTLASSSDDGTIRLWRADTR